MDCTLKDQNILITGVTGFVGSELLRHLLTSTKSFDNIYVVVRSKPYHSAQARWAQLQDYWSKFIEGPVPCDRIAKVKILDLDLIEQTDLVLPKNIDLVLHCAASTDLALPLGASRKYNVSATLNLLRACHNLSHLRRFVFFSTAYVSSRERGNVYEDRIPTSFNNGYEQSKFESEQLVRQFQIPYTILRPSIIVGDSRSGYTRGFRVLYSLLRIWLSGRLAMMPLDKAARVDVVPIDYVVSAALNLAGSDLAINRTFHLTAGESAVSPVAIMEAAFKVFNQSPPRFIPMLLARMLSLPVLQPFLPHHLKEIIISVRSHIPYLGSRGRVFVNQRATEILEVQDIQFPRIDSFSDRIFAFCRDTQWGKKTICFPSISKEKLPG